LLSSKNWLRADYETKFILLKLSGNEERGWLSGSDVTSLPCEDFQILDWLWSYYSGGRFGFSSQTSVWHSIGGSSNRADTSIETYFKFGSKIGWYKNKEWLSYSQMEFSLNSPFAHLPLLWRKKFEGYDGDWCGGSASIALKIAECKLQTKQNSEVTVAAVPKARISYSDNIDDVFSSYEDAIASYEKDLEIQSEHSSTLYNKARAYALQGKIEPALTNLEKAIELNQEKYCDLAKNDKDFDLVRDNLRFQELTNSSEISNSGFPNLPLALDRDLNSLPDNVYKLLKDFLVAEKWQEANSETNLLILKLANCEKSGFLRVDDIKKIGLRDLQIIDSLWLENSKGRFGFSTQQRIWDSCNASQDIANGGYAFGHQVGWCANYSWFWQDLNYSLNAPEGHLPILSINKSISKRFFLKNFFSYFGNYPKPYLVNIVSANVEDRFIGEFPVKNRLVRVYQGDITNLEVDVIVSSDINNLSMLGGIARRIRKVGGEEILREARNFAPLLSGQIAVTCAGSLRAKKVFHASITNKASFEQVIYTCINRANQNFFSSIALPLLATGGGGFPLDIAWQITLKQVVKCLSQQSQTLEEVVLVIYEKKVVQSLNVIEILEKLNREGWTSLLA